MLQKPDKIARWKAFLKNYHQVISAMDLFTVHTAAFGCPSPKCKANGRTCEPAVPNLSLGHLGRPWAMLWKVATHGAQKRVCVAGVPKGYLISGCKSLKT